MVARPAEGRPLRVVALGDTIVSDLERPAATSVRAVLAALADAGHDVTFLDRRNNPLLTQLLTRRGSAPYRAFMARYPGIQYRTYDLPRGWERTVWFGREIGTADIVLALPGTPEELLPEIAENASERLVRFVDASFGALPNTIPLARTGAPGLAFGPAVQALAPTTPRSPQPLVVAYDDTAAALAAAARLAAEDPATVVVGAADLPDWRFVPEVDLPDRYAHHDAVLITGAGDSSWAVARHLLPLAAGARLLAPPPALAGVTSLPPDYDAATQAAALVALARSLLP